MHFTAEVKDAYCIFFQQEYCINFMIIKNFNTHNVHNHKNFFFCHSNASYTVQWVQKNNSEIKIKTIVIKH